MNRNPPPDIIASWPAPNYIHPVSRGSLLAVSTIILQVVVFFVVGARLWARFVIKKSSGLDDWLVIFAMIPNTGMNVAILLSTLKYHFGIHIWDVPRSGDLPAKLIEYIIQLLSHWSTSFTKLSILLLFRRIVLRSHSRAFRALVKTCMVFQLVSMTVVAIVVFLDCRPLNAVWLSYRLDPPYTQTYSCIDNGIFWPVITGVAFLTDVVSTCLPGYIIHHLQIPSAEKHLMCALFSLGSLICVAGLTRLVYYVIVLDKSWDLYWDAYNLWYFTALEANGALICASAPALKPFIETFLIARGWSSKVGNRGGLLADAPVAENIPLTDSTSTVTTIVHGKSALDFV